MDELINDLLDDLVELDKKGEYIFIHRLRDRNGKVFKNQLEIAEYMESKGLLKLGSDKGKRCFLTPEAREISINGGWLKRKDDTAKIEADRQAKIAASEQLETDLAISNIEANKLNAKIAEQNSQNESKNRIAMWVNISVGVLNIVLLAIQIWLIVCKS